MVVPKPPSSPLPLGGEGGAEGPSLGPGPGTPGWAISPWALCRRELSQDRRVPEPAARCFSEARAPRGKAGGAGGGGRWCFLEQRMLGKAVPSSWPRVLWAFQVATVLSKYRLILWHCLRISPASPIRGDTVSTVLSVSSPVASHFHKSHQEFMLKIETREKSEKAGGSPVVITVRVLLHLCFLFVIVCFVIVC